MSGRRSLGVRSRVDGRSSGGSAAVRRGAFAIAAACAALVSACSGGFFPAPFATDSGPSDSASLGPRAPFLTIGDVTWSRAGQPMVHLAADGTLTDRGVALGKLAPDGVFTARGKARSLVMRPDGTVHVATGFDIQIDEDGTAVTRVHGQPDEALTLAQVAKGRAGQGPLTISDTEPKLRRTAMWILMIPDLLRMEIEE